jgi:polysaccharide pyruvyl transferase WcaK-like protein
VRILIDGLEHSLTNMGDVAMLQVAVSRLRRWCPQASIEAIVDAPERLARYCPGVRPIPWRGSDAWLRRNRTPIGSRLYNRTPPVAANWLRRSELGVRRRWPALNRLLLGASLKQSGANAGAALVFVESVRAADLIVVTGGGGMTDVFKGWALGVLDTLSLAVRQNTRTAMLSQGFGPIRDPALTAAARHVLPSVGLIAIREETTGPQLLRSLNVAPDRVVTTGDDAIELAYGSRTVDRARGIGVNLRMSSYSEVDGHISDLVRGALHDAAATLGADLVPVPVSFKPGESDVQSIERLLNGAQRTSHSDGGLDDPVRVVEQVKCCRVVVTGSYHPAVFALSAGIPVVGLARSEYYLNKFLGLAGQFGTGIEVLSLNGERLRERLTAGIAAGWHSGEHVQPTLLDAARRQIASGHRFYERVCRWLTG